MHSLEVSFAERMVDSTGNAHRLLLKHGCTLLWAQEIKIGDGILASEILGWSIHIIDKAFQVSSEFFETGESLIHGWFLLRRS